MRRILNLWYLRQSWSILDEYPKTKYIRHIFKELVFSFKNVKDLSLRVYFLDFWLLTHSAFLIHWTRVNSAVCCCFTDSDWSQQCCCCLQTRINSAVVYRITLGSTVLSVCCCCLQNHTRINSAVVYRIRLESTVLSAVVVYRITLGSTVLSVCCCCLQNQTQVNSAVVYRIRLESTVLLFTESH